MFLNGLTVRSHYRLSPLPEECPDLFIHRSELFHVYLTFASCLEVGQFDGSADQPRPGDSQVGGAGQSGGDSGGAAGFAASQGICVLVPGGRVGFGKCDCPARRIPRTEGWLGGEWDSGGRGEGEEGEWKGGCAGGEWGVVR